MYLASKAGFKLWQLEVNTLSAPFSIATGRINITIVQKYLTIFHSGMRLILLPVIQFMKPCLFLLPYIHFPDL